MRSLKAAMRWDEERYGREYDLDIYMIVAVNDFNMGAMENKGLNIFNSACALADPHTTTDLGFQRVESVIARSRWKILSHAWKRFLNVISANLCVGTNKQERPKCKYKAGMMRTQVPMC